jgi:hypothetical protein
MADTSTVTGRIIAIVEVLDQQRQLVDISRLTGVSMGTTHRILSKLTECGWVERREHGRYGPTDKLRQLGGPAPQPAQTGGLVVSLPAQSYVLVPAEWFVQHQAGRYVGTGASDG